MSTTKLHILAIIIFATNFLFIETSPSHLPLVGQRLNGSSSEPSSLRAKLQLQYALLLCAIPQRCRFDYISQLMKMEAPKRCEQIDYIQSLACIEEKLSATSKIASIGAAAAEICCQVEQASNFCQRSCLSVTQALLMDVQRKLIHLQYQCDKTFEPDARLLLCVNATYNISDNKQLQKIVKMN